MPIFCNKNKGNGQYIKPYGFPKDYACKLGLN